MSHIAITKVKLTNPNEQLLKKAAEHVARELNGELVHEVADYYGKKTKFSLGIKTHQIPKGVGISINKEGDVEFEGDFWKIEEQINNLKNLLVLLF